VKAEGVNKRKAIEGGKGSCMTARKVFFFKEVSVAGKGTTNNVSAHPLVGKIRLSWVRVLYVPIVLYMHDGA
jgi:hypothetical protein